MKCEKCGRMLWANGCPSCAEPETKLDWPAVLARSAAVAEEFSKMWVKAA
jgi:RNA polymerase subunit RPABC4/transcription elongation factor Spt4